MHSMTESLVTEHSTSNSGILLKVSVSCPCWPKTSVMITVRLCSPGDRSEMRSWSNNSPVTMEQHNQSLVSHHCCYTVSSGLTDSIIMYLRTLWFIVLYTVHHCILLLCIVYNLCFSSLDSNQCHVVLLSSFLLLQ